MNFQLDSLLLIIFSDFIFFATRNDPKVNCERSPVFTNKPMAGIAFVLSCSQTYNRKMFVDYHLKFCNAFPEDDQIQIKPGLLPGHWQTPCIAHESDPRLFTSLVSDITLQVQLMLSSRWLCILPWWRNCQRLSMSLFLLPRFLLKTNKNYIILFH